MFNAFFFFLSLLQIHKRSDFHGIIYVYIQLFLPRNRQHHAKQDLRVL